MKRLILTAALAVFFLAACMGETSAFPTSTTELTPASDAGSTPAKTATDASIEIPTGTAFQAQPAAQAGCTVQTSQSAPNPTVESILPAVTEDDWTVGPNDALVTILEYGDFQ